jgi:hypothetical protein
MRRLVQAVFLLICAAALGVVVYYFIRESVGAAAAARPVTTRQVVVSSADAAIEGLEARTERDAAVNHINALPNEVILDVATVNLDQDEGDEQVLTIRKTDRSDGRLSIVVADYLVQRRTWIRAYEGETLATKLTTFSIQVKDLLGDHNLNIICTGMNDANEQTATVFRRSPGSALLVYGPICSIAADSIVIDEKERSEGYQLGQTNGESWPLYAFSSDKDSQNILDQVKTVYSWDEKKASYERSAEERIPGAQVERAMISKVLTGSEGDFERFIQGIWFEAGTGPFDAGARLLVFDRPGSRITFYSEESQEVFTWSYSNPTRYGLYVGCQNESVSNLRRLMDVELTGADAITVRVFEDLQMKVDAEDRWDGTYRKLPASAVESALRAVPGRAPPGFRLDGVYKSADGVEISFAGSRFVRSSGGRTEKGGFAAYRLGGDVVLELSVLKEDGVLEGRSVYRAVYSEGKSGKVLQRRLVLSPARTLITGLELLEKKDLVLVQ